MKIQTHPSRTIRRLAVMGGACGNVPALEACIRHARSRGCDSLAFIGDATGCCGHSDEILGLVRRNFSILVAGNHEQQAAAGSDECSRNYVSAEDLLLEAQRQVMDSRELKIRVHNIDAVGPERRRLT